MSERDQPEFDAYSRNYDDVVNESLAFSGLKVDYFTRVKAQYIRAEIERAFTAPGDAEVLDIGCGVGNYHPFIQPFVRSIAGVDVSGACIETAKTSNPNVSYRVYDGQELPFEDRSFDVVYAVCVMHHVPPAQWPQFASEMRRVLRPQGLALVFEHNPFNPVTRHIVKSCEFDKDAVLLRSSRTAGLLRGAGFESVMSRFILAVPGQRPFFKRLDGMFSGVPLGAQYYTRGIVR